MFCRLISERLLQGENVVERMIVLWDSHKRNKTKCYVCLMQLLVSNNTPYNYCFLKVTQPWLTKWFIRWQFEKKTDSRRFSEYTDARGDSTWRTKLLYQWMWKCYTYTMWAPYINQATHQAASKFTNHK